MFYSGIKQLDELLGEIEEGRIVLIETVGGLGIEVAMSFVKDALKRDCDVFVVVSGGKERDIKRLLEKWMNRVKILKSGESFTFQELYTISLITSKRKEKFGLIEILQPLLIVHDLQKVYSLFMEMTENLRKNGITVVFTIDKKLVEDRVLAMFEDESDIVVEIEEVIEGLKIRRGIRIKKSPNMSPSEFYDFKIDKDGIHIGDKVV